MIERLYVDNYKCFVNFELPLTELNLLLGPNGVGKTTVLDVIYALRRLLSGEAKLTDSAVFPTATLTRWQLRNQQTFEIDLVLDQVRYRYRLETEHDRIGKRTRINLERLLSNGLPLFEFSGGEVQLYRDNHSAGPRYSSDWTESALARVPPRVDNTQLTKFLEFIRKTVICGIYPASFVTETSEEDSVLNRDASNFSSWYRHVLLERQDLVQDFTKAIAEVIDGFCGIRLEKVGTEARSMMATFNQGNHRYELRLDELSDGQRALLALYALVRLTSGQGYALLLDEPDNYVAIQEIQPWLIHLADSTGVQIPQAILCSHHPELVDYLGPDRGLILLREGGGPTRVRDARALQPVDGLRLSEAILRGWET